MHTTTPSSIETLCFKIEAPNGLRQPSLMKWPFCTLAPKAVYLPSAVLCIEFACRKGEETETHLRR